MIIILLGPPGAGKGTIAEEIKKKMDVPIIATGDILRNAIKDNNELGKEAKEYVNTGKLVPDDLIMKIIENRITKNDCQNGFVFDGFPRTIEQAISLDKLTQRLSKKIDQVFYFKTSYEVIIERLSSRRVCSNCGAIYNLNFNPPEVNNKCNRCGGKLIQREDDKEETIQKRLKVYNNETFPLVDYYTEKNILTKINADQEVEGRFKDLWDRLEILNLVGNKSV